MTLDDLRYCIEVLKTKNINDDTIAHILSITSTLVNLIHTNVISKRDTKVTKR